MLSSSAAEPKRPAWFWPVVITIVTVIAGAAWLIVPEQRANRQLLMCHDNMRQIALAIRQYAMDNDERYPPVRVAQVANGVEPWGWADAIAPYTIGTRVFQCPRERTPAQLDATQSGYTDYWYNGRMATVPEEKVAYLPSTILIGEGNDGVDITSSRYNKKAMPPEWLSDPAKPALRHAPGANYAFVDGHVKWCEPGAMISPTPTFDTYSFGLR